MARMHSRAKGISGSKKPLNPGKSVLLKRKLKEVELLIVKLAKENNTSSKIGLILRDSYAIPDVKTIIGKKIVQVLKEKKLLPELPEDLTALLKKALTIRTHLESNRQDKTAKRGRELTESKIHRLAKYYKLKQVLPIDWKYKPEELKRSLSE